MFASTLKIKREKTFLYQVQTAIAADTASRPSASVAGPDNTSSKAAAMTAAAASSGTLATTLGGPPPPQTSRAETHPLPPKERLDAPTPKNAPTENDFWRTNGCDAETFNGAGRPENNPQSAEWKALRVLSARLKEVQS